MKLSAKIAEYVSVFAKLNACNLALAIGIQKE